VLSFLIKVDRTKAGSLMGDVVLAGEIVRLRHGASSEHFVKLEFRKQATPGHFMTYLR
jgi:hypothetical protein